jgi:hypothetical protein
MSTVNKNPGNRSEKRGHWPKGKPRNDCPDDWPKLRTRIARLLKTPDMRGADKEFCRSLRGLSRYVDRSARQVKRWMEMDDLPSAESVTLMRKWADGVS